MIETSLHRCDEDLVVAPRLACRCECPRTAHSYSNTQLCEAIRMHPRRLAAPHTCTKSCFWHRCGHTRPPLACLHVTSAGWDHLVSYIQGHMTPCTYEPSIKVRELMLHITGRSGYSERSLLPDMHIMCGDALEQRQQAMYPHRAPASPQASYKPHYCENTDGA